MTNKQAVATVQFEEQTLPNGLRVIYAPLRNAPVVHVRVLYHVGSRNEDPQRQGFAHMFEHMMFRGSAHVEPEQHMNIITAVGGNSNAFTSYDQTTYVNTIPAADLETTLYLEADRMSSFKVNADIFRTERMVVAEEWRMRYANQALGSIGLDFAQLAYTKHPYRWTPIGDMDQLRVASPADLQNFFNTYYVPNNACLVIAGDIDIAQTKKWVNDYFGWIPKGPAVSGEVPQEPAQTGMRKKVVHKPSLPLATLYMGFKTTDYKSDDHYALSLLGAIFSSGRTGRLDRQFVYGNDATCVNVGAGDQRLEDVSTFTLRATVQQGNDPDAVQDALIAAMQQVVKEGVTQAELDKVRTQARQRIVRGRETCTQIATELGEEEMFGGDANRVNEVMAKLDALTPADIQVVAAKYLKTETLTVLQYLPEAAGPDAKAAATQNASLLTEANATKAAPVAEAGAPVVPRVTKFPDGYPQQPPMDGMKLLPVTFNKGVETTLPNGVKVITLTDHRLPLVNVSLVMRGGGDAEPADKSGLAGITAQMLRRGSEGQPFLQQSAELEARGINIEARDGGDTTALSFSCTTEQLDYAVKAAHTVLSKPTFPADEFTNLRRQALSGLVQQLNNPTAVAGRTLTAALHAGQPQGIVSTPQSIAAITLDDVKSWYDKTYQLGGGALVIISGAVTPEQGTQLAAVLLAGFDRTATPRQADYTAKPTTQPAGKPRIIVVDNPSGRQATIRFGTTAYDIREPRRFAGSLAGQIMSAGIGSRLNKYVRAEKGLTYGCSASFSPNRHGGDFLASVDTNPDTAGAAIEAMLKVFGDLKAADVTPTELTEAQTRSAGLMLMETQTISQQAGRRSDQILNGYPLDYWDQYAARIAEVKAPTIRELMTHYVQADRMTFVVVAPAGMVKPQLEKLGTVEVIPMPLAGLRGMGGTSRPARR